MKFIHNHFPTSLPEAVGLVLGGLEPQEREIFFIFDPEKMRNDPGFKSLARYIRRVWRIGKDEGAALRFDCKTHGLSDDPEEISLRILVAAWEELDKERNAECN